CPRWRATPEISSTWTSGKRRPGDLLPLVVEVADPAAFPTGHLHFEFVVAIETVDSMLGTVRPSVFDDDTIHVIPDPILCGAARVRTNDHPDPVGLAVGSH